MSKITSKIKVVDKDDIEISPSTETTQITLRQLLEGILEAVQAVKILSAIRGTLADIRVSITGGTVTVTNQTSMGGYSANNQIPSLMNVTAQNNYNNIKIT